MDRKEIFLKHLGLPSPEPLAIEIAKAEGVYLFTPDGKKYLDLCSGVGVNNIGHKNSEVVKAIKEQVDKYLHIMVYGELIQEPQVNYAKLLTDNLPEKLNTVF